MQRVAARDAVLERSADRRLVGAAMELVAATAAAALMKLRREIADNTALSSGVGKKASLCPVNEARVSP